MYILYERGDEQQHYLPVNLLKRYILEILTSICYYNGDEWNGVHVDEQQHRFLFHFHSLKQLIVSLL